MSHLEEPLALEGLAHSLLLCCIPEGLNRRRRVLRIASQAPDSNHGRMQITAEARRGGHSALCARIAPVPEHWTPADREDMRFLPVTWSAERPHELVVETELLPTLQLAQSWCECMRKLDEEGLHAFTLEILPPVR